jgi:choline dehydrogenase-like flavoprotein
VQTRFQQLIDWPIDYDELSPWYGEAEHEIGVAADVGEQAGLQPFPPGYAYPMPAIPQSSVDKAVGAAIKGLVIDGVELKVVTTPAGRNSQPYQNRRVCAGNTNCIPICPIQAKYDPSVTLAEALRTGNVTIWYRTVASEVVVGENDRISEIRYRQYEEDTGPKTGEGCVTATVFILAAHAIETPRLLLMSNKQRSAGVANRSGLVGKNLMDHPVYLAWALMPEGKNVFGYRGPLATAGIENLRDGDFRRERAAFRIEIGNDGWSFPKGDPYTTVADFINGSNYSGLNDKSLALFGRDLAVTVSDLLSRQLRLAFLLEQSPDEKNSVSLSRRHTDHLGLPRPLIRYDLSDYTKKGFAAAKKTADAIFARLGARQHTEPPAADDPRAFDADIDGKSTRLTYFGAGHIVGTYCMGTKRESSVVNREQRSWDHPNLFLVGSGVFPTVATANPTLTIAALSLWAADTILKTDLR